MSKIMSTPRKSVRQLQDQTCKIRWKDGFYVVEMPPIPPEKMTTDDYWCTERTKTADASDQFPLEAKRSGENDKSADTKGKKQAKHLVLKACHIGLRFEAELRDKKS